jgi:hypothetical protein
VNRLKRNFTENPFQICRRKLNNQHQSKEKEEDGEDNTLNTLRSKQVLNWLLRKGDERRNDI